MLLQRANLYRYIYLSQDAVSVGAREIFISYFFLISIFHNSCGQTHFLNKKIQFFLFLSQQVAANPVAGKTQFQWAQEELADERRRKREKKQL